MDRTEIIKKILSESGSNMTPTKPRGQAFAPVNIAVCKYWGKRDEELNLPITSSLSIALPTKGAFTILKETDKSEDEIFLNGKLLTNQHHVSQRIINFLDAMRGHYNRVHFEVATTSNVPISAGLASSSAGSAALVLALNDYYDWRLSSDKLSILARLGSGSAARSLWSGFVEWRRGESDDGMDSYGIPMYQNWTSLRVGLLIVDSELKSISSREAMQRTVKTAASYGKWPQIVEKHLETLKLAIENKNFDLFGNALEENSIAMHSIMKDAVPSIIYTKKGTVTAVNKIMDLRRNGINVFYSQDAGPSLKLFFLESDSEAILDAFPMIEILSPFCDPSREEVILVDESDRQIGSELKLKAHQNALLHRAFSVILFKQDSGHVEVLLQQRHVDKYHCGGLWSNTCCSHPRTNENIYAAASRRLKQEMGISAQLELVGNFVYKAEFPNGLTEYEFDYVFVGEFQPQEIIVDPSEVQDHAWCRLDSLYADCELHPGRYTPWLLPALDRVRQAFKDEKSRIISLFDKGVKC